MLQKAIAESGTSIPIYEYFELLEDEKSFFLETKLLDKNHEPYENIIAIDRKYLQRLLKAWGLDKSQEFLTSFYRGLDKADYFVVVSIKAIIKVFTGIQSSVNDKSTIDEFLKELEQHKSNGVEYFLINGQHRLDIFKRFFRGEINLNSEFNGGKPFESEKLIGKKYNELSLSVRIALLNAELPIVFVTEIGNLSDLKDIVIKHNTGNSWTPHQERMRETSYIARKFAELDEDLSLKKMFDSIGTASNYYAPSMNGISLLALQLYNIYLNENKRPEILRRDNKVFDDLVKTESRLWCRDTVDDFLKIFKKTMDEINQSYIKLTNLDKKDKRKIDKVVTTNVGLLKIYFLYRFMLMGKVSTVYNLDRPFKINNHREFVNQFVISEAFRRSDREQLTSDDKKLYDKLIEKSKDKNDKTPQSKINEEIEKLLVRSPKNSYKNSLSSMGNSDSLVRILEIIKEQFETEIDEVLKGVVIHDGETVSYRTKKTILEDKARNNRPKTLAEYSKQNHDFSHLLKPKNKGGLSKMSNVEIEPSRPNRMRRDKY